MKSRSKVIMVSLGLAAAAVGVAVYAAPNVLASLLALGALNVANV